jgi:mono/diheme cytochrome c family protein
LNVSAPWIANLRSPFRVCAALCLILAAPGAVAEDADFFNVKILPIFETHCYDCHSHEQKIKGGLALDTRSGLTRGGEGGPVVIPGEPNQSRLVTAVQHTNAELRMPPKSKLSDAEIAALIEWIEVGAQDPRPMLDESPVADSDNAVWEALYQERLQWWSLQPLADTPLPAINNPTWPRNTVDLFILAALEAEDLAPVHKADPRALVRRLSFALTGLPPTIVTVNAFAADPSPAAYDALVQSMLDSPHFGEHWARHWMDVVHYTDTHGYEWDAPAKNAWMYRDYLIRAYNDDISFQQLIREQLAGDLIEPRIDPETGLNESMLGPMALRLGERRHGDNAAAEGVTQEAVTNIIDTVSKGFLATTVACARCHDHKLDAVAQADYYSMAGVFNSSRWNVRSAETRDPNGPVIEELASIKEDIRQVIGPLWRDSRAEVLKRITTPPPEPEEDADEKKNSEKEDKEPELPESLADIWNHLRTAAEEGKEVATAWTELVEWHGNERAQRVEANAANSELLGDFSVDAPPLGWRIDGWGMKHGLVEDGALVVADEGDAAVFQLLPAGRWTHVWSKRLAGAVRSPLFEQEPPPTILIEYAGGDYAAQSLVVDNAFHSERMQFLKQALPTKLKFTAGKLAALAGGPDHTPRQVYIELVTKSLNNYYPPRDKYGGLPQDIENDPRSWFGVTRVHKVTEDHVTKDELARFETLFAGDTTPPDLDAVAARITSVLMAAVEHWWNDSADADSVRLINEALHAEWLPNSSEDHPALEDAVTRYRTAEQRIQPERVIGAADDWHEGEDTRISVRGSYTVLGEPVPRGGIRFLGGPGARAETTSSGRLEFAENLSSTDNPLVARVYVNRVWHHLFGSGLVRTVDDFGHLGETPSHPELLDWLANRFVSEGWSTKKLITLMVSSSTWRQSSEPVSIAVTADPENRLWHHMPLRRLEAESIRDAMLAVSGRLDPTLFGEPINPYRVAEDSTKRLYAGPLDGNGRRSVYQKMTLMEPPRFLALFNQPFPMITTGKRDTTNVPNQALALLNDPFVVAMAADWAEAAVAAPTDSPETRVAALFETAFARPPKPEETDRFVQFAERCGELHGVTPDALLTSTDVWQDVAHAIFNLKEFIYVQ